MLAVRSTILFARVEARWMKIFGLSISRVLRKTRTIWAPIAMSNAAADDDDGAVAVVRAEES